VFSPENQIVDIFAPWAAGKKKPEKELTKGVISFDRRKGHKCQKQNLARLVRFFKLLSSD